MFANLFFGLYLFPFFESFLLSVGAIIILRKFNPLRRFNLRREAERHIHSPNVSRLGGAAVIVSFLTVILANPNLFFSQAIWALSGGSLAILFFGLWDDFWELDWKFQLGFQILLAAAAYFWEIKADYVAGGMIPLASFGAGFIFTEFWLILNINSMNWLDGADGLSGGAAFLGAVTIFLLALKPEVNQPPTAIICAALAGAILGFLIFNFHPGKIMAGTSGSMFFGFALGALAIFAGAKVAAALLVMAIPIVDFVWVIGERLAAGVSIFAPDQRHWHRKLLRLGWTQRKIALYFYGITLMMAVLALNTRSIGKIISISAAFCLIIFLLVLTNKKLATVK